MQKNVQTPVERGHHHIPFLFFLTIFKCTSNHSVGFNNAYASIAGNTLYRKSLMYLRCRIKDFLWKKRMGFDAPYHWTAVSHCILPLALAHLSSLFFTVSGKESVPSLRSHVRKTSLTRSPTKDKLNVISGLPARTP